MKNMIRVSSGKGLALCAVAVAAALLLLPHSSAYADPAGGIDASDPNVRIDLQNEVSAQAGPTFRDTSDTYLGLYLDRDTTFGSQIRRKDGPSSVYVNIWQRPNVCMLYTDGMYDTFAHGRTNCTRGGGAYLHAYGKFEIYNYVNEWGFPDVQVTALRTGQDIAVIGQWSPDYSWEPGVSALN